MRRRLLIPAAAVVLAAGCGFTADQDAREITPDELFGLDQTTTTSSTTTTTTTTIPTTVTATVNSEDSTTSTTNATSTTMIVTQPVELYFLDGSEITSVSQNLAGDVPSLQRVLGLLQSGPPGGDAGIGLQTALPRNIFSTVTASRGVATVDLDGEAYERIDSEDELPAIAQIVLTLTRQSGVGQVRFTVDGEALPVRLGSNLVSRPGEPVSADDYAELLGGDTVAGSLPPETSATTDTTPPTPPTPPPSSATPPTTDPSPPATG